MNFINNLLNDRVIISKFKACKKANNYRSGHDISHAKRTISIAKRLSSLLGFSDRELLLLQTCLVFHDIEQVGSRDNHEIKAAEFAKNYLLGLDVFSDEELEQIYSAILTHDEYEDYSKLKYDLSWRVNLVDKLDFTRYRLDNKTRKKWGRTVYSEIERLKFELNDNIFKLTIKTIMFPKTISEQGLFKQNLFSKAMKIFVAYANHFGMGAEVYLENQKLNLENIKTAKIFDDGKVKNKITEGKNA